MTSDDSDVGAYLVQASVLAKPEALRTQPLAMRALQGRTDDDLHVLLLLLELCRDVWVDERSSLDGLPIVQLHGRGQVAVMDVLIVDVHVDAVGSPTVLRHNHVRDDDVDDLLRQSSRLAGSFHTLESRSEERRV